MGYTHYWRQLRDLTPLEWKFIKAETERICAKAQKGLYSGKEDFASATKLEITEMGFREGFNEGGAWRTFPNPTHPIPMQGAAIALAGGDGKGRPEISDDLISLNGKEPESYETFYFTRKQGERSSYDSPEKFKSEGCFNFCKTEYRPYDAVVVSILAVARKVAPDAILVETDGDENTIRLMF